MGSKKKLPVSLKPMMAQSINLAEEVEDEEEDCFLAANPTIIPVFEIHVEQIIGRYVSQEESKEISGLLKEEVSGQEKKQEMAKEDKDIWKEETDTMDGDLAPKEAINRAEFLYDKMIKKVSRVKEDDLQDINLGSEEDPKMVKVSIHLDEAFKEDLRKLLIEFSDVFAWDYFDLKCMDPEVNKHQINLREDAVPVIQQCYRMNPNYAKNFYKLVSSDPLIKWNGYHRSWWCQRSQEKSV